MWNLQKRVSPQLQSCKTRWGKKKNKTLLGLWINCVSQSSSSHTSLCCIRGFSACSRSHPHFSCYRFSSTAFSNHICFALTFHGTTGFCFSQRDDGKCFQGMSAEENLRLRAAGVNRDVLIFKHILALADWHFSIDLLHHHISTTLSHRAGYKKQKNEMGCLWNTSVHYLLFQSVWTVRGY